MLPTTILLIVFPSAYANIAAVSKHDLGEEWLIRAFQTCSWTVDGKLLRWTERFVQPGWSFPVVLRNQKNMVSDSDKKTIFTDAFPSKQSQQNHTWISARKHQLCKINLHYLDCGNYSKEFETLHDKRIGNSKALIQENPFAFVLILEGAELNPMIQKSRYRFIIDRIAALSVTSLPVIYWNTEVLIVNPAALYNLQYAILPVREFAMGVSSTGELLQLWKMHIKNFHQRVFFAEDIFTKIFLGSICNNNKQKGGLSWLWAPARVCARLTLAQYLNYSIEYLLIHSIHIPLISAIRKHRNTISNRNLMSHQTFRNAFSKDSNMQTKYSWIHFGCEHNHFRHALFVTKQRSSDTRAMFQPIDTSSSILLGITTTSFGIILCRSLAPRKWLRWRRWNQLATITTRFLLFFLKCCSEQSDPTIIRRTSESKAAGFIALSAWLLSSILLINEYKSYMYTCMTTIQLPSIPETINDVIKRSSIPCFTLYDTTKLEALIEVPINLTTALQDSLFSTRRTTSKKSRTLKDFRSRYNVLKGSISDIVNNISRNNPVDSERGRISMPEEFVLIGRDRGAVSFEALIRRQQEVYVVHPNNAKSKIIVPMPWVGKRDILTTVFADGLGLLEQSGIYQRWVKHSSLFSITSPLQESGEKVSYDQFVFEIHQISQTKVDTSSSPISITVLAEFFKCCYLVIFLSLSVFLLELCRTPSGSKMALNQAHSTLRKRK